MPVEIKELIIRATITAAPENTSADRKHAEIIEDREALIAECVKQVLKILRKSKER